ncbi:1,2-dihydroxy-3-keto-5-methylthiopentene dioxygenase [Phyllosticta citriasiana]|uniref:Acireductone dioxygenase n=1 Tax=Phyllosticta citriasiana TaxID=595635 RepID=A0ABR1KZA5_9PEZI
MRAYYYDNLPGDQRLAHDSGREVPAAHLASLGIHHYHLPSLDSVNDLAAQRAYKNRDEVTISPSTLPNYEDKVKAFFAEHLHEDEEIRYILDGAGYFDVRSEGDEWIRIRLEKYDMMIMPPGIYHRFTTDEKNVRVVAVCFCEGWLWEIRSTFVWLTSDPLQYTKAMRLFQDDPKWTPLNRGEETDKNTFRQQYLESRAAGTPVASH